MLGQHKHRRGEDVIRSHWWRAEGLLTGLCDFPTLVASSLLSTLTHTRCV